MKKAVKSAADYNAQFMRELREERRAYFDLQTQVSLILKVDVNSIFIYQSNYYNR